MEHSVIGKELRLLFHVEINLTVSKSGCCEQSS